MLQVELPQIDAYTPVRLLGEGSTTDSYLYRHEQRKKYAVIKLTRGPLQEKEAFLLRAKLLKKLKHRNITEVQDFGILHPNTSLPNHGYLITQYTQGGTVYEHFARGQAYPADQVKRVLSPLADALHYAHVMNAVHGNLHPGNILMGESKDFLLTDFSLLTSDPDSRAAKAELYRAPEHLKGSAVAASDQYSLAVMVYEWLCGRRPYEATSREQLLFQQEHEPLLPPSHLNTQVSALVEQAVLRALAVNPGERFPQTLTFADTYLRALMGFAPLASSAAAPRKEVNLQAHKPSPEPQAQPAIFSGEARPRTLDQSKEVEISAQPAATSEQAKDLPQASTPLQKPRAAARKSELLQDRASDVSPSRQNTRESEVQPGLTRPPHEQIPPKKVVQMASNLELKPAKAERLNAILGESSDLQRRVEADLRQGGALSRSLPGYEERPAQIEMARLVARALTDNVPAIIEASTGTGKALDVDTPIPTPDGWKRMGDLRVGDVVFDERGQPTHVTAAFAIMQNRPCYEVVFSDGSSLIADAEHEWASYTAIDRQRIRRSSYRGSVARQKAQVDTLLPASAQLIAANSARASQPQAMTATATGERQASTYRQPLTLTRKSMVRYHTDQQRRVPGYHLVTTAQMAATLTVRPGSQVNHAIAVAGPLALPEANLPLAPYLLGVELGKGTAESLPAPYLRASRRQRRELLAGLLGSGGALKQAGQFAFTTTKLQFARDLSELICSLGLQVSLQYDTPWGQEKSEQPAWTLTFTPDRQTSRMKQPCLTSPARLRKTRPADKAFRYVIAVRKVASRPVRCIQVEADSHLYLAGRSMIPTHNSLSYLIPVVRSDRVAIISTANKALQEQLFYKDIPFVQKYIRHFEAALVKGMGNYICLDRVEQERAGIQHYVKNRDFQRLLNVLQESDEEFAGDFETLGFTLPPDIRGKVNADSDQCSWSKCSYFSDCFVRKMKVRASHAAVIVVNHTLLLLDALMEGYLLPERDVIVIDEAHHLEEEATRAFTVTINQAQISTLLAQHMLKENTPPSLQEETKEVMTLAWERLLEVADPGYKGRANLKEPLQEGLGLASIVAKLADALRTGRPKDLPEKEEQLYDKLISRAQNLADNIRTVFSVNQAGKYVYYVERVNTGGRRGNQQLEISAAPLEITNWLKEQLFEKSNVICTSATLATLGPNPARPETKGPNFAYFRRRVGLDHESYPDAQETILPLTFDYEDHALLYLPRHLPEPAYGNGPAVEAYTRALADEMIKLVRASRGRAFLLFSSKRMLDEIYTLFQQQASDFQFPLLRQGDTTRLELVRTFRASEGAVLFGLKSFWEGVDIAGQALSLVVIDKLPFDPPDDPVHEARVAQMKAAGENWFGTYVLPQTVLRLKQGLGRLLRTYDDRGVMAILDTRLHTKSYGRQIVQALPPARRTMSLQAVEQFFQEEEDEEEAPF